MMAVTQFSLQILFIIGFLTMLEALVFSNESNWNYTLKNVHGIAEYTVEYTNLGHDCSWLHKKVATYKMPRGYSVYSSLERTADPAIQRINISWPLERDVPEYLLTIKLLRPENEFYVGPNDTVCIYVQVKQAQEQMQFQQTYMLIFDCIEVRTGTIGAAMEMILRKRAARRRTECKITDTHQDRPCFREMPELYTFDIDAHCCSAEMPDLKVVPAPFCTWIVSTRSQGVSSVTYVLRRSNGTLVDQGHMLEDKTKGLFARGIPIESPDTFTILVSFWCSFDPNSNQRDHMCWTDEREINAMICNRLTSKARPQKEAKTKDGFCFTATQEFLSPECVTIITLGCVAVVILSTVCVFLYCRDYLPCCRATLEAPRNNTLISNAAIQQTNETSINEMENLLINNILDNRAEHHDPEQNVDDGAETKVVYVHR